MQNMFGGSKQLNWEHLADYAQFLSSLHEAGEKAVNYKGVNEEY